MTDSRRGGKLHKMLDFSGGYNCETPTHAIELNELSDVQNLDIDSQGRLVTRKGFKRFVDSPIADKPVNGLIEHVERDGRRYVIAICNGRFWRLNAGERTWSQIYMNPTNYDIWGANLITNGDFSAGTTGWTISSTGTNTEAALDTTHGYGGGNCLSVISTEPLNLVTNPGFNTYTGTGDTATWTGWGVTRSPGKTYLQPSTAYKYEGSASVRTNTDATWGETVSFLDRLDTDYIPINVLDAYQFGFYGLRRQTGSVPGPDVDTDMIVYYWDTDTATMVKQYTLYEGNLSTSWTQHKYAQALSTLRFTGWESVDNVKIALRRVGDVTIVWPRNPPSNHYWDYVTLTARPRYEVVITAPKATIDEDKARVIQTRIKRTSGGNYGNITLVLYAYYYDGADTLIATETLTTATTDQSYKNFTITQAAGGVPSGAVGVRIVYKISGYYPAYDDTAAGHGFYIDELEINELEGTATSATEVIVDEDIIPSIVTFMGNIYIFGFDKNIKLMSGEAIDFLPSYPENAKYACVHQNRIFIAGERENPNRLYYTNYTSGGGHNADVVTWDAFLDFDPDDGDEITGISPCGNGVVVFKRRGTFMLTGSNAYDWFARKVSSAIGCASHHSIVAYHGSVIFLDENTPGIFLFDGGMNFNLLSQKITPRIRRLVREDRAIGVIHNDSYMLFCDDRDAAGL